MSALGVAVVSPASSDEAILDELNDFERWYTRATSLWGKALFILRTMVVLTGFVVALLTALTVGRNTDQDIIKITVIVVSSLGTLAATILTQYRVGEIERLRAAGRIATQRLRLEAEYKLPALTGAARGEFIARIIEELTKIETEQNDGFYAHFSRHGKLDHQG